MLRSERKSDLSIDVLPNELVIDILARLPGKQIGICKCVCKLWRSTIRSRPFRDTYRKNSGLLLYNYRSLKGKWDICFFHCPLRLRDEPPGDFSPLTEFGCGSGPVVTELVDGMLCSYANKSLKNRSTASGLTLHNICIGENMRIPNPLNCIGTLSLYNVGPPSTWRELADSGLPSDLNALCRVKACSDDGLLCWLKDNESIVWFDLNNERFQLVELPEDVKCGKKNNVFRAVTRLKNSLTLCVSSSLSNMNISCYVQEDEEGKKWRILKEFEVSRGFTFAAGIFPIFKRGDV